MILIGSNGWGRERVCLCAVIFAAFFFVCPSVFGDFINPSFELYDPNGGPGFPTASDWVHVNYAADVNNLMPELDGSGYGGFHNWPEEPIDLKHNGLDPIDGERLLMLSTGNIGHYDSIDYAKAWQHVSTQEGDRIRGYYFFGTCDYLGEFDDFATITLVDTSATNPNDIELMSIRVTDVGSNSSMYGWELFEYVFNSETAGEYDLTFYVEDERDQKVNSYLGIDDLQHCPAPISYGDFNYDCKCDNADFAIISDNWLIDCSGPPETWGGGDPNDCNAWLGSGTPGDTDGNNLIDIEDLRTMSTGWSIEP